MIRFLIGILLISFSKIVPNPAVPTVPEITVCSSPEKSMADFATDPIFRGFHPPPLTLDFDARGGAVSYETADGKAASAYLVKAKKKTNKWLFVYQEWWGLNDHIRQESDKWYEELGGEVNVLALDLYDGKVTADPQEAGRLMRDVEEARLENIVKGAYAYVGKSAQVGHLGWCFGGSWSLKGALLGGMQTVATVIYYGMPVKEVAKLKTLNSDVLGIFATEEYISREVIESFAVSMEVAGKELTYQVYDAVHGFANPSNPKYDARATQDANDRALRYLKARFRL